MILASAGLTFMSVNALPIFSKLDVQSLADPGAAVCMPQQLPRQLPQQFLRNQ